MSTTDDIRALLRARYPLPSWCFLEEVRDATGWGQRRTADALALDCYPSRGLEVYGFEIKASRGDWLKELKDSGKHASVATFCDRWWIVAPAGVVKKDELPRGWGLMTAGDALRVSVQAPLQEKEPMDACFVASLVRTALNGADARVKVARTEGWDEGHAAGEKQAVQRPRDVRKKTATLVEAARAFQAASGIGLLSWGPEHARRLGLATKVAQTLQRDDYARGVLRNAADAASRHADALKQLADDLEKAMEGVSP